MRLSTNTLPHVFIIEVGVEDELPLSRHFLLGDGCPVPEGFGDEEEDQQPTKAGEHGYDPARVSAISDRAAFQLDLQRHSPEDPVPTEAADNGSTDEGNQVLATKEQ